MIKSSIENITPDIAREYLSHNTVNRTVSKNRVEQYARDMANGEWQLNGEGIVFSENGDLKDGQHRLRAIIKSNTTVPMNVIRGVKNNTTIFDRGRARSVADSMLMDGFDKKIANSIFIGAARLHYWVQGRQKNDCSDAEIRNFLLMHETSVYAISDIIRPNGVGARHTSRIGSKVSIGNASFVLACMYAYESGVSIHDLRRFSDIVYSGFYDKNTERSAVVYRNDILALNIDNIREKKKACYQTEKAISDFVSGKQRVMSYKNWDSPVFSNAADFSISNEQGGKHVESKAV